MQAYFNAPRGNEPLALDMENMGKGQTYKLVENNYKI